MSKPRFYFSPFDWGLIPLAVAIASLTLGQIAGAAEPQTVDELLELMTEVSEKEIPWSADMELSMSMMGSQMTISGDMITAGKQSKSEMSMNMMGQVMTMRTVLDHDGIQWTEVSNMGQTQVMKMDMDVLMEASQEMTGMMNPMGGSFMDSMDAREMLEQYKSMYDLEMMETEAQDDVKLYKVEGTLKEEKKGEVDPTGMMAQSGLSLDRMTMVVGADGIPRGMTMYGPEGEAVMEMEFKNVATDIDVDESTFEYTPPEGVPVMDMTEMIRSMGESAVGENSKFSVGDKAPDFEATTLDGETIKLSDYQGKVVLIDFWATWCAPCIDELPNVTAAYEQFHEKNFEIIGISLDETNGDLTSFLEEHPEMTWSQIYEGAGWESELANLYGVDAIPATFLVDIEGNIAAMNLRGEALSQTISETLAE